ncbi:HNH endonuclease signature motif containing protein [Isoptericola variabilis]|uniref:HNH endonuclease n=1 Tax=Isoptericola variabilis (strain 225) TaxID=743718 RepID=F6FPL8_ISOV2|nr:HNH endonuclease signature motif containing protein [Isoptericola variabilis]AEG44750.1 HNH endonuclease [Isoptericola variabilis 225]TWH32363.1 uncharacterized protein DUF222 [Isoptericola variabilis J7]
MTDRAADAPAPDGGGRLGNGRTGPGDGVAGVGSDVARLRAELDRLLSLDLNTDWRVLAERAVREAADHIDHDWPTATGDVPVAPAPGTAEWLAAAGVPSGVVDALDVTGPASLRDVDATWDLLEAVQRSINALEAVRAVLVERGRRQAERCQDALVDDTDPVARTASATRRSELAQRATVADLAGVLHVGETAAGTLMDHSQTLATRAPGTLAALARGDLSWRHATAIAKHVDDLDPAAARRVETAVLAGAGTLTPRRLEDRVRAAREEAQPTPPDVRHAEARANAGVWVDPAKDGMAYLTAYLPAAFAYAAYDRLTATAQSVRADGDGRSTGQLRADVLCDLLLDDGTLDVSTAWAAGGPPPPDDTDIDDLPRPGVGSLAPLARSIKPRVTVTVPVLTLLGMTDAPATLEGHVPIDPDTARALCAHAPSFRRVLTHPETGAPLSVGRSTYAVPADLKAVLAERDRTCRFPGCTRPARRTDVDHTTPWSHDGVTAAGNLAHLCRRHHVLKHQTAWSVRHVSTPEAAAATGGVLEWTSPTGRVQRTYPERPAATRHATTPQPFLPPDLAADEDDAGDPPF